MKRLSFILALSFLGIGSVLAQNKTAAPATDAQHSLDINATLPGGNISMIGTDHKQYTLNDVMTKKGLLVMFSCNTCPYVIKSQPRTKEMIALAQKNGLGIAIINSNIGQRNEQDSYDAMIKYATEQGYTVPYLVDDGPMVTAFGATHTPEVFLFNAGGTLVYKGAMEDNPSDPGKSSKFYLKDAINNLAANKTINPNTTHSIGCTIKLGS
jgi:thioredoxin-related protein